MTLTHWIARALAWVGRSQLSLGREAETDISDRGVFSSRGMKAPGYDASLFTARDGKQYANLWALIWAMAGLIFTFFFSPMSSISGALAILTLGKWQFSLICEGPPEPSSRPWNEFISPQWDANDWCYNNITPCHNHLCILKGEEMCCFCHFLSLVSPLERTMTSNTNPWKGSGA